MSRIEELIKELCPNGVEYKKLKDISEMKRGTSITKKTYAKGKFQLYPVDENLHIGAILIIVMVKLLRLRGVALGLATCNIGQFRFLYVMPFQ